MPMLRRSLPLALTIAVHLLLLACFYLVRPAAPPFAAATQRTMLMLIVPKLPPPVKQKIKQTVVRTPSRPQPPVAARTPRAAPDASPVPVAVPVQPEAPVPDALAGAPVAGDLAERARRSAGTIDRELRAGKPVALSADSRQARFEQMMASAYVDKSNTLTVDRYGSGDGVIIERLTRGGKSSCYMSGTVNFVPGILRDSSKPKTVTCPPAGAGWTRH